MTKKKQKAVVEDEVVDSNVETQVEETVIVPEEQPKKEKKTDVKKRIWYPPLK